MKEPSPTHTANNIETLKQYSESEVKKLLQDYQLYKLTEEEMKSGAINQPQGKRFSFLASKGTMVNFDPKAELQKKLDEIGARMKFQNPLIWLRYKNEAYEGDPQKELKTLADLINHCTVDGICHRRFDAINLHLRRNNNGKDLRSPSFVTPETRLSSLVNDERYLQLCLHEGFMSEWAKNENDPDGKWAHYIMSSPDHDCSIKCTC